MPKPVIREQTKLGMLEVWAVIKLSNPKRFRVIQHLMHRCHRKYGYNIGWRPYSNTVYEAFLDGQPFGWFFIKQINRVQPGWAQKGWVGYAPLTKFTSNIRFDFHSLGRNSRDKLKAFLWGSLSRYLFAGRADFLRETVALATVQDTRHTLEPFLYGNVMCVGANHLSERELRDRLPLNKMTGNGKLTFYAINPKHLLQVEQFCESDVKQAVRTLGWSYSRVDECYYGTLDDQKQDPIRDIIPNRLALSRSLRRK